MLLKLQNITKQFESDSINVLHNLNFQLKNSEIVSIIGPSGSGKTTFLQIVGLLDNANSGMLFFNGQDCSNLSEEQRTLIRRNSIGFIYQFHHLLAEFTALENLVLPQLIAGINKYQAISKAKNILNALGLEEKYNNFPSQLSGGQRQRVAIARAIINKPKLLLADEPTGNLDPPTAESVIILLLDILKKYKMSAIIVTHNIELAKKTDRILLLKDGILKEE